MTTFQEATIPTTEFNTTLVAGSIKGAMKSADAKSRDLWLVPLRNIRTLPEFNVRIRDEKYLAHLRMITNSIKTEGFYQYSALAGYVANEGGENIIYLTGGHTRFEATGIANQEGAEIESLPVIISPPGTSREDLVVALIKGNEGKPLTPYETAIVCKRLVNYGWDIAEIATRLEMAETYVDGLLLLIGAPQEIREMVQAGQLAATTAIQTLRSHGSKAVDHLQDGLTRAKASGANRVTAKHLPGSVFKSKVKKAAPAIYETLKNVKADPGYAHISDALRAKLDDLLTKLAEAEAEANAVESKASEGTLKIGESVIEGQKEGETVTQ